MAADRKTALFGALAWWFARRWVRRRAQIAVAGLATGAAARRGKLRSVVAALGVVGALAVAFVAWRKLFARADEGMPAEPERTPAEGRPAEPVAAPPVEDAGAGAGS